MRKHVLSAISFAIAGSLAASAVAQMPSTKPADVKAGTYIVDPGHTQVGFGISHFGFSNYFGQFSRASGTLRLDPAHVEAASLEISVPIDSVQTTSTKLDGELKSADWFDAAKYPTATFVSTRITPHADGIATIEGNLTLHGVTKPVTLKARLIGSGVNPLDKSVTVGFQGEGVIKRSDFGVKTYLPLIGDEVTLNLAAAFTLKS